MANTTVSAQSCTILEVMAFPSSLAALKHGIKWNASCWVANQRLNDFEQEQIGLHGYHGHQRTPHIEWCQFATDVNDTVAMLIVFPELKTSFRSPEIMQRWTDTVVLPAFRATGIAESTLTSNFKVIQMTAEAEREQTLNCYAPDTTLTEVLSKKEGLTAQDMHSLWASIQENANKTAFFDGFKSIFLVIICRPLGSSSQTLSLDETWRSASLTWEPALDMDFVSTETVRANVAVTLCAQQTKVIGLTSLIGGQAASMSRTGADGTWESCRKRRMDDDDGFDKRAKMTATNIECSDDADMQM